MPDSIKKLLQARGILKQVLLPIEIDTLLTLLEPDAEPLEQEPGNFLGDIRLSEQLSQNPVPGLDLSLTAPTALIKAAPFRLLLADGEFKLWLVLAKQGQAQVAFKLLDKLPGLAFTGATVTGLDGLVGLEPRPAGDPLRTPLIVSRSDEAGVELGPALLIAGEAGQLARMRFTTDTASTEGVTAFGFEPPTVVFGGSSVGFECPHFVVDDSESAPPDALHGVPGLDPPLASIAADTPAWRGFLARELSFYLPRNLPVFGGHPIRAYFALPFGPGGANLVLQTQVPATPEAPGQPARLGYALRIECLDPTASGFSGLLPTLISASLELPLDGASQPFTDQGGAGRSLTFAAGKPVRLTATLSRDPVNAPGELKVSIAVSAQGPQGILCVTSSGMGGAKIFNTVAALATSLIADQNLARNAQVGDTPGVVLYALAAAGAALSSLFEDDSQFVLHGVEIEASGHGAPVGGPMVMSLDYSVSARVVGIDLGALSVSMRPDQPMRVRIRKARMSLDPRQSGLSMVGLNFDKAEMEVENPGAWDVQGLEQLFDVLGSRSGRGSSWVEVDLRFKLNLGPVRVSGATIRATLNGAGRVEGSIRGLQAGLVIPGAIEGEGALALISGGFEASLLAKIVPLNLIVDAGVLYAPEPGPPMVLLRLGVDLPAPLPLANTGFGLFGIGGLLGISAVPDYTGLGTADPVLRQLEWQPKDRGAFRSAAHDTTFGLDAAVGTLPDLGFSFSAKAGLLITVPDVAVRGSLNGRVLHPAVKLSDPSYPPSDGVSFLGFIGVDAQALAFGVLGRVDLGALLQIRIPLAGRFPFGADADDWYLYLGDDGRSLGPVSARVLPTTLNVGADAYLMFRGHGVRDWPHDRTPPGGKVTLDSGFVAAFGFAVQSSFGVAPIAWAELYASLDLLIGAKPPTLAGFGRAGGSLHLGPFSLGVEAQINFMSQRDADYFWAEVTGRIELLFFDIEGKVTLAFGDKPVPAVPDPERHPLDRLDASGQPAGTLGALIDDSYRVLAPLAGHPDAITDEMRVWPDALVSLPFAVAPAVATPNAMAQFPAADGALPVPARIGNEMLYYMWSLDRLELVDVTDEADPVSGAGVRPAGQLACRWQVPRGHSGPGDVSELVLFSTSSTLWLNRVADAGAGMAYDPLQAAADLCHTQVGAQPGWAIGGRAEALQLGLRLPPEPLSQDPLVSRVEATLSHFGLSRQLVSTPLDGVRTPPAPYSLRPAALRAWPADLEIKHRFHGHLVAPSLHWLDGRPLGELLQSGAPFAGQQIELALHEPVTDGLLMLAGAVALFHMRENFIGVRVFDDAQREWVQPELLDLPTGEKGALYRAPGPGAVGRLLISYPLGAELGVVGVGGVTLAAAAAAAAQNQRIQDEVARQQAAKAAGPKTDPTTNLAHQRTILEPGRTYRLDIDMSWTGKMFKQNEAGQVVSAEVDRGPVSTNRKLFFKTTPKPQAPAHRYDRGYAHWLYSKQDVFHPDMVARYLAGYEPAQSESFRFCDDPLKLQFRQDHVPALAKAYGFTLSAAVRRVDAAGDAYANPLLLPLAWAFADTPDYLSPSDRARFKHVHASACDMPGPGAAASALTPLEPLAWYELYLLASSDGGAFADARMPGVTFRTSRWRGPEDMLVGLGFKVEERDAATVVLGDLPLSGPGAPGPGATTDQGFHEALAGLGLEGWPLAEAPRLSRLWAAAADGAWLFAGLMVESPEPIARAGRLDLQGLALEMGRSGAPVRFNTVHRDRSGSRLVFLANAPFRVVTRELVHPGPGLPGHIPLYRLITPTLVLQATSTLGQAATPISGSLLIPTAPSFSKEP